MSLLNDVFKTLIIFFIIQFVVFFLALNNFSFFNDSFFSLINFLVFVPLIFANLKLVQL